MFDPKTKKFPYPLDTSSHYIILKKDDGTVFDRDYPYLDKSPKMKFKQGLMRLGLYTLAFPIMRIRLGLKIKGRENLKKYKAELQNGVITCCNHVHFWDYIAVMCALIPHRTNLLAWDKNVRGENAALIRMVGGIPIPIGDVHASIAFNKALEEVLRHGWLHIYSEGSMWEYYQPIRPFKTGTAYLACKLDKPILPLAFSYREPGFIRKKIFKQIALFTLTIGEPINADKSLKFMDRVTDLTIKTQQAVCRLAGIDPKENIYPPVYDNSQRIDYY